MDNFWFIMLVVALIGLGACLPKLWGYTHIIFKKISQCRKSKIMPYDDSELRSRVKTLESYAPNVNSRIEAIEKKLGQVEVDSYGHMIENPTIVPQSELRKQAQEKRAENGADSWKVL